MPPMADGASRLRVETPTTGDCWYGTAHHPGSGGTLFHRERRSTNSHSLELIDPDRAEGDVPELQWRSVIARKRCKGGFSAITHPHLH